MTPEYLRLLEEKPPHFKTKISGSLREIVENIPLRGDTKGVLQK